MRMLGTRVIRSQAGLWLAGLMVITAAFGGGYWYSLDSVAARYDTVLAETRDIVRTVNRAGRTVAARDEQVRFGVSGTVSEVPAVPGEQVRAGQVIARLDNPAVQLAASQALVSLELARLKLEDQIKQVNDLTVRAPISGRVASIRVMQGDTVSRGGVAAVIEDPDRMVVEVRVPEHLVAAIKPGMRVNLAFPTLPGRLAQGWVSEVSGSLQGSPGSATASVEVAFSNPGGVVAGITVVVSASLQSVMLPVLGRVVARPGQVLAARDAATVASVNVAVGQSVLKGDVLVELENPLLSAQLQQSRFTYTSARQRYEDTLTYYNPDDQVVAYVRVQYEQAKSYYDQLLERVEALRVTAPFPGTLTAISVETGDAVTAGSTLARLVPQDFFLISAQVPTAQFATLAVGQTLRVDLPETGAYGLSGTVAGKSGQGTGSGGASFFEITVEARAAEVPWPGTVARLNLPPGNEVLEVSGTARAAQQETVRFGASGTVATIDVAEGATVSAGDGLIILDNESLVAAGATLPDGAQLARGSALLDAVAGPALREEILRTRSAELTYQQRVLDAQALTLKAPYAGILADVKVKTGDVVGVGTVGATVIDVSSLDIVTDISELDVGSVFAGDQMDVYFPALPQSYLTADVLEIGLEPKLTSDGALYPLRLRLSDSTGVRAGMSCVIAMVTDIRRDVVTVPVEAVHNRYGAKAVQLVVDRKQQTLGTTSIQRSRVWKGPVEWVYVVTGVTDGVYVEILKGLPLWSEVVVGERKPSSPGGR